MIEVLIIFIWSILTAYITFNASMLLNSYMDFGEVFDFIRLRTARYFNGGRLEVESLGIEDFEHDEMFAFDVRQGMYKEEYSNIAFNNKWFNPFICVFCMSEYIGVVISLLGFSILWNSLSIPFIYLPIAMFFNSLIKHHFLRKEFK